MNVKNANIIELKVELDDTEMVKVTKKFLEDLNEKFAKYNIEYDNNSKRWKSLLNSGNKNKYFFTPEKLTKKSPLTICDVTKTTKSTYKQVSLVKHKF